MLALYLARHSIEAARSECGCHPSPQTARSRRNWRDIIAKSVWKCWRINAHPIAVCRRHYGMIEKQGALFRFYLPRWGDQR